MTNINENIRVELWSRGILNVEKNEMARRQHKFEKNRKKIFIGRGSISNAISCQQVFFIILITIYMFSTFCHMNQITLLVLKVF